MKLRAKSLHKGLSDCMKKQQPKAGAINDK